MNKEKSNNDSNPLAQEATKGRDTIKVGLIGFGRMGCKYLKALQQNARYEVAYICDVSAEARQLAHTMMPTARVVDDEHKVYADPAVQVVVLCTLANYRKEQIEKAVRQGKHIISEKPIADTIQREWDVVRITEEAGALATVNLYLRNSWYHQAMRQFIDEGELGQLAILRICHMTPGLAPGEGHEYEGPCFHDCGMHYVDIARWYAQSEYATWHAQGLRMWSYKDPWWLQCHGTFESGVVYDITQGFVYGQMSKDQTHNSYVDIIGTEGIVRMHHDFKTAVVELRGTHRTELIERPYGDKNIDVLIDRFADSIEQGTLDARLPSMRDSAIASQNAWNFLDDARQHALPAIGHLRTLEQIIDRRRHMTNGYGLLTQR